MAVSVSQMLMRGLDELRFQPTAKRIRALRGDVVVVVADSTRAALVWEPRRVVPVYTLPVADVAAPMTASSAAAAPAVPVPLGDGDPVLDPRTGFGFHSCPGTALAIEVDGTALDGVAFRPDDPELADLVLLDFEAFDWLEEDEPVRGHPRDPFHRVDVRRSSRRVRMELDGVLIAESDRSMMLFETGLPLTRFYLPREDVRVAMTSTATRTWCAYKGEASYFTVEQAGEPGVDVAWSYERPLPDCPQIAGLVAFFQERLDVIVDGAPMVRPRTPWSEPA